MKQSITWSIGSLIISYFFIVLILYFGKPNFVVVVNTDGKKKVQKTKVFYLSFVISICISMGVFILKASNSGVNTGINSGINPGVNPGINQSVNPGLIQPGGNSFSTFTDQNRPNLYSFPVSQKKQEHSSYYKLF
jgi:hypothetical protein